MATHKDQVVVVTGGSAGVGRATVRAFAQRGANVAILARGQDGIDAARREVEEMGGRALGISVDVSDAKAVLEAAEQVEQKLGPIDIWVNDAMTSVFAPFWEIKPKEFQRVTDVTYHGQVNGTRAALKYMRQRDRGVIVQVGSAVAYRAIPLQSAYSGAKAAVRGFTDSIRVELMHEKSHIHITEVNLPAHNTPQFRWVRSRLPRKAQPVPPIYQPELAADAIVWASEHRKRQVDLAWPSYFGIWAQKLFPSVMDRYVVGAWEGQMIDEPAEPSPDNLFDPVPGDHGAHGVFDDRATDFAPVWLYLKYRAAAAAVAGVAAAALLLLRRRTS
jgi:NAD(P)-dependent dehydrogenase (short-subunit alcohol dehydrogenase family)